MRGQKLTQIIFWFWSKSNNNILHNTQEGGGIHSVGHDEVEKTGYKTSLQYGSEQQILGSGTGGNS